MMITVINTVFICSTAESVESIYHAAFELSKFSVTIIIYVYSIIEANNHHHYTSESVRNFLYHMYICMYICFVRTSSNSGFHL